MSMFTPGRGVLVAISVLALSAPTPAIADEITAGPLDRATVLREAVARHPSVGAADQRARATALTATAAGKLPAPEVMLQIWQVPIAKPYAISDAGMVMVGVGQSFPAPGARGARESAGNELAAAERAMVQDRVRILRRDADHAFADYVEATNRHRIHVEHRAIAARALDVARSRLGAGAPLTDVTQAEVELARVEADVIGDRSRMIGARGRLNALLARDASAPLGPPVSGEPETSAWDLRESMTKALATRPEIRAAAATQRGRTEEARAAKKEATLPSFSIAALYFAPVGMMPVHGYGANASMSLPWLWGDANARREAADAQALAARRDAEAATIPVTAEVAQADTNRQAAALRLQALRDRALPATKRSFEVVWAGYETARTDILTLLSAQRAVVDVESEVVAARASLDHALAELDAAVGQEVPRRPLGPLTDSMLHGGDDDGR